LTLGQCALYPTHEWAGFTALSDKERGLFDIVCWNSTINNKRGFAIEIKSNNNFVYIKVIKDDNKSLNDFIDFIKQNGYKVLN